MAKLARSHRDAVREAGGIAMLTTLLRTGSPEVQGMVAAVLRDLATDSPANRVAILNAGGLEELVRMLNPSGGSSSKSPAGGGGGPSKLELAADAAGALKSLSNGFVSGCRTIVEAKGVDALVAMIESGEVGSSFTINATGVLANLASADASHCEAILKRGGVKSLVFLLIKGNATLLGSKRRVPQDVKARLERSAEEVANAVYRLAEKSPSCATAIRENKAIAPLVDTMFKMRLDSTVAQNAAKAVMELVKSDEQSKMLCLREIAKNANDDKFDGQGWSLSFPGLRAVLQSVAEELLTKAESGTSASGMNAAIEIARAVELPQTRLDASRLAFDDYFAKMKRDKLSKQSEERRRAKEEEIVTYHHDQLEKETKARAEAKAEVMAAAEAARAMAGGAPLSPGGGGGGGGLSTTDESKSPSPTKEGGGPAGTAHRQKRKEKLSLEALGPRSQRAASAGKASYRGDTSSRAATSHRSTGRPGSSSKSKAAAKSPPKTLALTSADLQFIPRAQLLEKIEKIAALNRGAGVSPPKAQPPNLAAADMTEAWRHKWDNKFPISVDPGFKYVQDEPAVAKVGAEERWDTVRTAVKEGRIEDEPLF